MNNNVENTINDSSQTSALTTDNRVLDIYNAIVQEILFRYDIKDDIITFYGTENGDLNKSNTIKQFLTSVSELNIIEDSDIDNFTSFFKRFFIKSKMDSLEFRSKYFSTSNQVSWFSIECRSFDVSESNTGYIVGRIKNIDDIKETISKVKYAADIDPVSKLFNYKAFCEQVDEHVAAENLKNSIMLIAEIDGIRTIEAELGCECADAFIRRFGEHLYSLFKNDYIIGHDKYRFLLFAKKEFSKQEIDEDISGVKNIAKCVKLRGSDDFSYNVNIGKAVFDKNNNNIRNIITTAENDLYHNKPFANDMRLSSRERNNAEYDKTILVIMEKLLKFADILFNNFETYDISQTAFGIIADDFDICNVTVTILQGGRLGQTHGLYSSSYEISEDTPYIEESFTAISGNEFNYRIYRHNDSIALSPRKVRMLRFVFEIIHTYANRYASMQTAKYAKTHDMRLNCLNTHGFIERMDMLEKRLNMSEYAIIFMNVKNFRTINARVGFVKGNQVLYTIVDILNSILKGDEFFCCMGGDNFFVFLRKANLQKNIDILNNIKCTIEANDKDVIFTISFRMGIYEIENDMISGYRARENASIAFSMTRIPNSPYISYLTPQKKEIHELRKTLEIDLKPALQNGDFFIKLQPKVNLNNYTLVGAEALSRWNRNGEFLPPLSFIPHFEQNGMIVDIDFFVLDSVCKLIRKWLDKGLNVVPISINFSKITLESYDYLNNVLAIIEKYNIPPKYIEIEFTETCCMENEIKIKELLNNIKEHGIKASLDDFGTGYSSINMLKNMNFNMLKLDKSFLSENKEDEEREKIILTNIIKMAKSLSLEIVSEGVETIEQANYLKYLKCDCAQGYLFDRPLSVEDFEKRLISPIYDI